MMSYSYKSIFNESKEKTLNIQDLWNLQIKCLTGLKKFQVEVESNISILELKESILIDREILNEDIEQYRLIYKGHILKNGSIKENGLSNGDTIHLIVRPDQHFFSVDDTSIEISSDDVPEIETLDDIDQINSLDFSFQDSNRTERQTAMDTSYHFLIDQLRKKLNFLESDINLVLNQKNQNKTPRFTEPWSNNFTNFFKIIQSVHSSINDNISILFEQLSSLIKIKKIENLAKFNKQIYIRAIAFRRLGKIFSDLAILYKKIQPIIFSQNNPSYLGFHTSNEDRVFYSSESSSITSSKFLKSSNLQNRLDSIPINNQIVHNGSSRSLSNFLPTILNQFNDYNLNMVKYSNPLRPSLINPLFQHSVESSYFIVQFLQCINEHAIQSIKKNVIQQSNQSSNLYINLFQQNKDKNYRKNDIN